MENLIPHPPENAQQYIFDAIEVKETAFRMDGVFISPDPEGRSLVLKLLTRKLGNISPEIQAQVNSLTLDRVEALGEDLLDFTQREDLNSWLATDTNVKID